MQGNKEKTIKVKILKTCFIKFKKSKETELDKEVRGGVEKGGLRRNMDSTRGLSENRGGR